MHGWDCATYAGYNKNMVQSRIPPFVCFKVQIIVLACTNTCIYRLIDISLSQSSETNHMR